MNLEYILKTIMAKNTSQWTGNIEFEQKTTEKLKKEKVKKTQISFHFYHTQEGIPMISLAHNVLNITLKTDYIIHFNNKLLGGMMKDLETAIQYMIYSGEKCSSTAVVNAIETDMQKYQQQMQKQQIKGARTAS